MHRRLQLRIGDARLTATLTHTLTAVGLWEMLPVRGQVRLLMGEMAMTLPAPLPVEGDRRSELAIGEIAYRQTDQSLSLFHGATPQSLLGEPRTEAPVSLLGMLEQEPAALSAVRDGDTFTVERHED